MLHACLLAGGVMTYRRGRPEHKQTVHLRIRRPATEPWVLRSLARLGNPPLLFVVPLLAHGCLTENVHGQSGPRCHRVLQHSAQPETEHFSLDLFSGLCCFRATRVLSSTKVLGLMQKPNWAKVPPTVSYDLWWGQTFAVQRDPDDNNATIHHARWHLLRSPTSTAAIQGADYRSTPFYAMTCSLILCFSCHIWIKSHGLIDL